MTAEFQLNYGAHSLKQEYLSYRKIIGQVPECDRTHYNTISEFSLNIRRF
jgi:hypothetical protein